MQELTFTKLLENSLHEIQKPKFHNLCRRSTTWRCTTGSPRAWQTLSLPKSFCKSQFLHKIVNLLFILVTVKDKLTIFAGIDFCKTLSVRSNLMTCAGARRRRAAQLDRHTPGRRSPFDGRRLPPAGAWTCNFIRTSIPEEYDFPQGIGALPSGIRLMAPIPWAGIVFLRNTRRD